MSEMADAYQELQDQYQKTIQQARQPVQSVVAEPQPEPTPQPQPAQEEPEQEVTKVDPDTLPYGHLNAMARYLKAKTYKVKAPEDVHRILQSGLVLRNGQYINQDWQAAHDYATVSRRKRELREGPIVKPKPAQIDWEAVKQGIRGRKPKETEEGKIIPPAPSKKTPGDPTWIMGLDDERTIKFHPGNAYHQFAAMTSLLHPGKEKPNEKQVHDTALKIINYVLEHEDPNAKPGEPGYWGRDWYEQVGKEARAVATKRYPELEKDENWEVYVLLGGLTCARKKVRENIADTDAVYRIFRETGRVTLIKEGGKKAALTAGPRAGDWENKLQRMLDDFGGTHNLIEWLKQESPVEELDKVRRKYGWKDSVGGKKNEIKLNAEVFGPKIGPFFASMSGKATTNVFDSWAMKTWHMLWNDASIKLGKGGAEELNVNVPIEVNRKYNQLMLQISKETGLSRQNVQAMLWYFQIRLAMKMGLASPEDAKTYGQAAEEVFRRFDEKQRARGFNEQRGGLNGPEGIAGQGPGASGVGSNAQLRGAAGNNAEGQAAGGGAPGADAGSQAADAGGNAGGERALQKHGGGYSARGWDESAGGGGRIAGSLVAQEFRPSPEQDKVLSQKKIALRQVLQIKPEAASTFHDAILQAKQGNKYGASVYAYPEQEYANMTMLISPDGKTGAAIKPDGDIVSGFNTHKAPDKKSSVGNFLVTAVQNGGNHLDCFNTVLPKLYAKFGFKVVARIPWDDSQAPPDWNKEAFGKFNKGQPDVVFMVYDGGDPATLPSRIGTFPPPSINKIPYSASYDDAVATQMAEVQKLQARKKKA